MQNLRPPSIPPPPSPTRYYRALSRRTALEFDELLSEDDAAVSRREIEIAFEAVVLRMESRAALSAATRGEVRDGPAGASSISPKA